MYELVKKKNIGLRILIGIIILFAITQTLKFFLREPALNINDELVKTANEINKHVPIVIDSLTTFDNVNALKGNTLQYNYTLNIEKDEVDSAKLIEFSRVNLIEQLKRIPKQLILNKVVLRSRQTMPIRMGYKFVRLLYYPMNINFHS
ncbi:MAG: hypothetical protein IPF72_07185 [Chitinophagaceae bacterium]|nr:hypothetical protein [Chitinophagaceae bacterium]